MCDVVWNERLYKNLHGKREDGFRLNVINANIEPAHRESGKDEQIRFEYYMKLFLFSLFFL